MRIQYPFFFVFFHNLLAYNIGNVLYLHSSIIYICVFPLTLRYIFEKSVREKEGLSLPNSSPKCEWSSSCNQLPVAWRGCISFLKPRQLQALFDRMHHAAVARIPFIISSTSASLHLYTYLYIYMWMHSVENILSIHLESRYTGHAFKAVLSPNFICCDLLLHGFVVAENLLAFVWNLMHFESTEAMWCMSRSILDTNYITTWSLFFIIRNPRNLSSSDSSLHST